jgi:hypothetical protein
LKRLYVSGFGFFVFAMLGLYWWSEPELKDMNPLKNLHVIMLAHSIPNSIDPIHSDQTNNIFQARLIHLTPLQVTIDNKLESEILSNFSYDNAKRNVTLKVRSDRFFSDGTQIEPKDVLYAITRFAFFNPSFPFVESISGINEWREKDFPLNSLPTGIKLDNSEITISLDKNLENPLFRLALEVFAVIPSRCIDRSNGKLTCDDPPMGGYYLLAEPPSNTSQIGKYTLRKGYQTSVEGIQLPEEIWFHYVPINTDIATYIIDIKDQVIVFGNQIDLLGSHNPLPLELWDTKFMPSSRFAAILINENVPPFENISCRQAFAKTFRDHFKSKFIDKISISSSLFTAILPGFLSDDELINSHVDSKLCREQFENAEFNLANNPNGFSATIKDTVLSSLETLGAKKVTDQVVNSDTEINSLFLQDKTFISLGMSGFWAQDPVGDLQMLFTPGFHKRLSQVTLQPEFMRLIEELKLSTNANLSLMRINQFLYADAKFNVFCHSQRFYAVPKNTKYKLLDLPSAITAPSPWHLLSSKL